MNYVLRTKACKCKENSYELFLQLVFLTRYTVVRSVLQQFEISVVRLCFDALIEIFIKRSVKHSMLEEKQKARVDHFRFTLFDNEVLK